MLFAAALFSGVAEDPTLGPAEFAEPSPRGTVRFSRPLIVWPIRFASATTTPSAAVTLNGEPTEGVYDPVLGAVVYRPKSKLSPGEYNVECTLRLPKREPVVKSWRFFVSPEASEGPAAPTAAQAQALRLVNTLRALHRLDPVVPSPELLLAAQAHADYVARNRAVTHDQTPGKPCFLGVTVPERLRLFAYPWHAAELVGFASTDVRDSVVGIFGSPFHRIRFLTPGAADCGVGVNGNYVCLLFGPEKERVAVPSPPDAAPNVPRAWPGGMGFPRRPGQPYGYPILLRHGRDDRSVKDVKVTVTADGEAIRVKTLDGRTERYMKGGVVAVPDRPLPAGAEVEVMIRLTTTSGQTLEFPWSFTTEG